MSEEPRVLFDPSTGRPVLMAPDRHHRPRDAGAGDAAGKACPFCGGREDRTPPELDRTGGSGPAWTARAFPNRYPACRWHEVIAEGPEHTSHPAQLPAGVLRDAVALWRRRIRSVESREGVMCAFLFKNVGYEAGSSMDHNHTQLLGLPVLPPRLVQELQQYRRDPDLYLKEIEAARAQERMILEGRHHVVLSPAAPKLPFETWLLPRSADDDFADEDEARTGDLAACLSRHFGAIASGLDTPPLNSYLHRVPGAAFHWHIELQPRTGTLAGLELGGDMSINSVTGQESARILREALGS